MWIVDLVKFRPADAEVVSGLDHILPANTVYSPVRPKGALGLAKSSEYMSEVCVPVLGVCCADW
jgi:hypothetical protein